MDSTLFRPCKAIFACRSWHCDYWPWVDSSHSIVFCWTRFWSFPSESFPWRPCMNPKDDLCCMQYTMDLLPVHFFFSSLSDFEFITKILIFFLELFCLFDYLSVYWSTASLQNKVSFTNTVSSWINLIKSPRVPSLCSFLLKSITARTHLSLIFPGSLDSSMQIISGVSSGFHSLDFEILSLKNYKTYGNHLHHYSLIEAMLWSLFCTCSWCYRNSHTFVLTFLWHYHTQQLQVVEHITW